MVKPGYKQTEIGVIPEDWDCVQLGEKAKIYRGGSPRPIQDYITTSSNGVNWIKIGDVGENDKYIRSTQEKITPEGIPKSREVHIGDFILSNSMSFGRPYILDIDGCIHDGWLTIQDYKSTFSTEYLYYLLSSNIVYQQYISMAAGSSVKNLNKEKVSALHVIYPSGPEQKRIAEALSDMDELIFSLEKLIAKYKSIKSACLQRMFPQNGEKVPRVRLPGFTDAWKQRKLSEVILDIADGPFGSNLKSEHYTREREARIIQLSNLSDYGWQEENTRYTTFNHANEIKRCIVNDGEMVMAKMMPAGMTIICPNAEAMYVLSSDCVRIKLDESSITNGFFLYTTKSALFLDQVNNDSQGSTRVRTSISKIRNMDLLLPSLEEQQKISELFTALDNLITFHQRKLEKVKKVKEGMMQELLTGKIRLVGKEKL